MAAAQKVVAAVRSSRSEYGLTVRDKAALMLACTDGALAASLAELGQEVATLSSSSSVRLLQARVVVCCGKPCERVFSLLPDDRSRWPCVDGRHRGLA